MCTLSQRRLCQNLTHMHIRANFARGQLEISTAQVLEPMELDHLPYKHGKTFEEHTSAKNAASSILYPSRLSLKNALQVEYVVLRGGKSRTITTLPPNTYLGDNEKAREVDCAYGAWKWRQDNHTSRDSAGHRGAVRAPAVTLTRISSGALSIPEPVSTSYECSSHQAPPKEKSTNRIKSRDH
jgi:hypothetical protein